MSFRGKKENGLQVAMGSKGDSPSISGAAI